MRLALPFLLDVVFVVAIVGFGLTQILIPIYRGTPLFPAFNRKQREAERKLEKVKGKEDLNDIINEFKQRDAAMRPKKKSPPPSYPSKKDVR